MNEIQDLRELWRLRRVQRLQTRILAKHNNQNTPISNKVLGLGFKQRLDNPINKLFTPQTNNMNSKMNHKKIRLRMNCLSEPKIKPRDTKLSSQRKCTMNFNNKFKKMFNKEFNTNNTKNTTASSSDTIGLDLGKKESKTTEMTSPNINLKNISKDVSSEKSIDLSGFKTHVKGLDTWLMEKGQRFDYFKNLKTITLRKETTNRKLSDTNKRFNKRPSPIGAEYPKDKKSSSSSPIAIEKSKNSNSGLKTMLVGGLQDLCAIVKMGYPDKNCEAWLTTMREYYPEITKHPLYWECKAMINSRLCEYKPVAQIDNNNKVNKLVNDLIKKFEILHLQPSNEFEENDEDNSKIDNKINLKKNKVLKDINTNNLINSTSIQFEIKKNKKDKNEQFYVRPVRRSARINKNLMNKLNLNVDYVSSISDLSKEIYDKMDFKPNMAFFNDY